MKEGIKLFSLAYEKKDNRDIIIRQHRQNGSYSSHETSLYSSTSASNTARRHVVDVESQFDGGRPVRCQRILTWIITRRSAGDHHLCQRSLVVRYVVIIAAATTVSVCVCLVKINPLAVRLD